MDALCATQGDRLVVVLGGVDDPHKAATAASLDHFGDGPGRGRPGHRRPRPRPRVRPRRAVGPPGRRGWPEAPRARSRSRDLLPERALAGDGHARRHLVDEVYLPLVAARGTLIETLSAYFQHGASIEATARALFVHPNTVRYRLRQVADAHRAGRRPDPRDAFTLQLALS